MISMPTDFSELFLDLKHRPVENPRLAFTDVGNDTLVGKLTVLNGLKVDDEGVYQRDRSSIFVRYFPSASTFKHIDDAADAARIRLRGVSQSSPTPNDVNCKKFSKYPEDIRKSVLEIVPIIILGAGVIFVGKEGIVIKWYTTTLKIDFRVTEEDGTRLTLIQTSIRERLISRSLIA